MDIADAFLDVIGLAGVGCQDDARCLFKNRIVRSQLLEGRCELLRLLA